MKKRQYRESSEYPIGYCFGCSLKLFGGSSSYVCSQSYLFSLFRCSCYCWCSVIRSLFIYTRRCSNAAIHDEDTCCCTRRNITSCYCWGYLHALSRSNQEWKNIIYCNNMCIVVIVSSLKECGTMNCVIIKSTLCTIGFRCRVENYDSKENLKYKFLPWALWNW